MTIRAVVFDFGGVLFDWSPHHLYRKLIADDHERQWFLDNICTQAWNTEQDAGRPLAEATQILIDQHPHPRDLITAFYEMTWPTSRCRQRSGLAGHSSCIGRADIGTIT